MSDLTPEQVRHLRDFLKANAALVAPGETLVIRSDSLTPAQMREVSDMLNWAGEEGPFLPFRTIVVPGEGLGVVGAETDEQFAARVAKAVGSPAAREVIGEIIGPLVHALVTRGDISINTARAALGMKPFVFR